VKRYHVEDGTAEIDRLLDGAESVPIISRLGFVETLSALATKVRASVLSVDGHDQARKRFLGDVKKRRLFVVRLLVSHYHGAALDWSLCKGTPVTHTRRASA
jgi:hypothetical protein